MRAPGCTHRDRQGQRPRTLRLPAPRIRRATQGAIRRRARSPAADAARLLSTGELLRLLRNFVIAERHLPSIKSKLRAADSGIERGTLQRCLVSNVGPAEGEGSGLRRARDYSLGWQVERAGSNAPDFSFGLRTTRHESSAAEAEHRVGFEVPRTGRGRRISAAQSPKDRQNNLPICVIGGVAVWSRRCGRCQVRCRCERRRFTGEVR